MAMDDDSRKKLQQFWRKRILMGLGIFGAVGLGFGTIEAIRSTQEKLQFSEGRALPEQFYQQQIAALSKGKASICLAVVTLGVLKDERAIPALEKILQDDRNKTRNCSDDSKLSLYDTTLIELGKFQQPEATAHLKTVLAQSPTPELIMQVMAQPEQPSDDIRNLVLKALPTLKKIKVAPSTKTTNQTIVQSVSTTEEDIRQFISSLLRSGSLDDRTIQSLIVLAQDKTVHDGVLIGLVKAFKRHPKYEWLSDLLFIKMLKADKISATQQIVSNPDRAVSLNQIADPRVVDAIVDLLQTNKSSPFLLRGFLERNPRYAKASDRIVAAARKAGLNNIQPWFSTNSANIPPVDGRFASKVAALQDSNPAQRQDAVRDLHKRVNAKAYASLKDIVVKRFGVSLGDNSASKTATGYYVRLDNDRSVLLPPTVPFFLDPDAYYISHREIEQHLSQNSGYQKFVAGLRQSLNDANAQVRADARLALIDVIQDANQVLMRKALQDPNPDLRQKAIEGLCGLGTKNLPIIMGVLQSSDLDRIQMQVPALNCLISWIRDERNSQAASALLKVLPLSETISLSPFKVEGPDIRSSEKTYADATIEAIAFLHDRGQLQLTPAEIRQVILTILKQDRKGSNNYDPFVKREQNIRLLKAMYDRLPVDQAETDRLYLTLNLQRGLLTGFGVAIAILLVSSLRLRNPFPLIWSGYLLFPEEMIAELIALKQRRQAAGVARHRIYLELTYEVLLLLWAVHIQMRIDDLNLPPDDRNRAK